MPADERATLREMAETIAEDTWRPRPRCRDCADEDGTCPGDGRKCDPREQLADVTEQALKEADRRAREDAAGTIDAMCAVLRVALPSTEPNIMRRRMEEALEIASRAAIRASITTDEGE